MAVLVNITRDQAKATAWCNSILRATTPLPSTRSTVAVEAEVTSNRVDRDTTTTLGSSRQVTPESSSSNSRCLDVARILKCNTRHPCSTLWSVNLPVSGVRDVHRHTHPTAAALRPITRREVAQETDLWVWCPLRRVWRRSVHGRMMAQTVRIRMTICSLRAMSSQLSQSLLEEPQHQQRLQQLPQSQKPKKCKSRRKKRWARMSAKKLQLSTTKKGSSPRESRTHPLLDRKSQRTQPLPPCTKLSPK